MTTSTPRRRGAPRGNLNNFKHGFYSRRLTRRDLNGLETIDGAGLVEEIALIRVFTRRLVESFDPNSGFYEHADILRILCIASFAITRVIRTQALLSASGSQMDDEISIAIRQVNAELRPKKIPSTSSSAAPTSASSNEN